MLETMEVPRHVVRNIIVHFLQPVRGRVQRALLRVLCKAAAKCVLNNMPTPLDRALNSRVG